MSSSLTGQVSNAGTALNKRLAAFRQRFSTVLGRHHGYDELSSLEQPLVHDGQPNEVYDRNDTSYFQQHGVDMPGQQNRYTGRTGPSSLPAAAATASHVPDPVRAVVLSQACSISDGSTFDPALLSHAWSASAVLFLNLTQVSPGIAGTRAT